MGTFLATGTLPMSYLLRELMGWVLVGLGLGVFVVCILFFGERPTARYLEAGPLVIVGVIIFRGGIHLLKVATAARACSTAAEVKPTPRLK